MELTYFLGLSIGAIALIIDCWILLCALRKRLKRNIVMESTFDVLTPYSDTKASTIIELEISPHSKYADLEHELALLMQQSFELFKRKNSSYGTDNIAALGVKGIFVRLWDKINRLKTLVWFGGHNPLNDESISDTFMDISVYALIALLIIKNVWPGCKVE